MSELQKLREKLKKVHKSNHIEAFVVLEVKLTNTNNRVS